MSMYDLIRDWHRSQWDADYGLEGVRMVTGCTLWGRTYVDHFLAYGAPSLRTNVLDGVAIVLFVDGPTERLLAGMEIGAAQVQLRRLPEPIVQGLYAEPNYKYALLAAVHNLLIRQAGKVGAGFHMLVGDAVYSAGYLDRLETLSRKHDAIAHTGMEVVDHTAMAELDGFRHGDRLEVPARLLGDLGWRHFNPQWASWTMDGITDFAEMPDSHYIHWRGRDHVRIHCAHQSAAWISPERCRMVEAPLGGTIDSELPRYMAGSFYTPRLDDDMVYVVIACPGAGSTDPVPRVPFATFKREFWRYIDDRREFLPYFLGAVHVPVAEDPSAPSDAELDGRLDRMMAMLEEGR